MRPAQRKFSLAGGARPVALIAWLAIVGLLALAAAVTWQGSGEAAFPGDNGKIAFTTDFASIYVMNADGTGQTRLTNNPPDPASDHAPAWSPDGAKIAFYSDRDGNPEVYVMNADGTGLTRLTNNPATDAGPAWSPDGMKIAFYTNRDGNDEIYVMNADGTGPTRLTNNPASDAHPAWSPDGTKIAFRTNRDGDHEIYVMNADGTGPARLTNALGQDAFPAWSPDGSRIAFAPSRDSNNEIYVMNADGTGQTNLTNNSGHDGAPAWSPDGTKIAFHTRRDGRPINNEIYVMNTDGTGLTRLTFNGNWSDTFPDWQPLVATPTPTPGPAALHGERGTAVLTEPVKIDKEKAISGLVTFTIPQPDTNYTATFVSTDVLCRGQMVTDKTTAGFRAICGGNFRDVTIDWVVIR